MVYRFRLHLLDCHLLDRHLLDRHQVHIHLLDSQQSGQQRGDLLDSQKSGQQRGDLLDSNQATKSGQQTIHQVYRQQTGHQDSLCSFRRASITKHGSMGLAESQNHSRHHSRRHVPALRTPTEEWGACPARVTWRPRYSSSSD